MFLQRQQFRGGPIGPCILWILLTTILIYTIGKVAQLY